MDRYRLLGAAVAAAIAGAVATLSGTGDAVDLRPTILQVALALGVAALTVVIVPIALPAPERASLLVLAVALFSVGAAAVHFAVIWPHLEEWWGFGAFFVASAVAQLGWSILVATWPSRSIIWAGVLGNAAIVALWAVTRTEGTLVGPEPREPESIGVADGIATGFEILIVVLGVSLLSLPRARSVRRLGLLIGAVTLALITVALLSVIGAASDVIPPSE